MSSSRGRRRGASAACGKVVALPRQGATRSFEALARSVTQDVHPRSLLDELCRLGLAEEDGDQVRLVRESVVARPDSDRAYQYLGNNVGDHLRASVANLLADAPPHVEQAVFADGLSDESMASFHEIARTQWQALLRAAVPALQALVDADRQAGRDRGRRVRIGLYSYDEQTRDTAARDTPAVPAAGKARRRSPRKD